MYTKLVYQYVIHRVSGFVLEVDRMWIFKGWNNQDSLEKEKASSRYSM